MSEGIILSKASTVRSVIFTTIPIHAYMYSVTECYVCMYILNTNQGAVSGVLIGEFYHKRVFVTYNCTHNYCNVLPLLHHESLQCNNPGVDWTG